MKQERIFFIIIFLLSFCMTSIWGQEVSEYVSKAIDARIQGNDQLAFQYYMQGAKKGDADCQFNVGSCLSNGKGVKENSKGAINWYLKAAEQNHSDAQYVLGVCYLIGKGVKQSYEEAVRWFLKSAKQGNTFAQSELGSLYEFGRGVPVDLDEALKWYRLAAAQGDLAAQSRVKKLESVQPLQNAIARKEVKDERTASRIAAEDLMRKIEAINNKLADFPFIVFEWDEPRYSDWTKLHEECRSLALQAANTGYPPAQTYYADKYSTNKKDSANFWYKKAADQGYAPAQVALGKNLIRQNLEEAMNLIYKAVDQKEASAFSFLGDYYMNNAINKNGANSTEGYLNEALKWYKQSEEIKKDTTVAKSIKDTELLIRAYAGENLTKEEYYRANKLLFFPKDKLEWLVKAAELGHHQAQYEAGKFFYLQKKDYNEARKWMQKAVDGGIKGASAYLRLINNAIKKKENK
ncbi:MAG: hypothetical protein U0N13_15505 [Parabacteroides johnsonii]